MPDYNLFGLSPRNFEHLTQALVQRHIAPGATPWGDGPDGGREFTFEGAVPFPSINDPWNGYIVGQCKFKQVPKDLPTDGKWAVEQARKELQTYLKPGSIRRMPDYYLFVTNVKLTPVREHGTREALEAVLAEYATKLSLKGFAIWSSDELSRFIDSAPGIRKTYLGFITPGDILDQLHSYIDGIVPGFYTTLSRLLQKELLHDRAARLESAGRHTEHKIPLSRVFIDLPATRDPGSADETVSEEDENSTMGLVGRILHLATSCSRVPEGIATGSASAASTRIVVVGGPGQGKSTLGQQVCQLLRVALLRDRPANLLVPEAAEIVDDTVNNTTTLSALAYAARRFPIRIGLAAFADVLSKKHGLTLLVYLADYMTSLGGETVTPAVLLKWLQDYPWLVVLDGLDEVPPSSNRAEVLKAISDFRVDASSVGGDVFFVATTRPQSYSGDFSSEHFDHWYLTPLSPEDALRYGTKLADAQFGTNSLAKEPIARRLETATRTPATARLMTSPLQVTIMFTLVQRYGEPPRQRYRLFEQYYRTIYDRETSREGPMAAVLAQRQTDVDNIHYRTGLLLQARSESAGEAASTLTDAQFADVVLARLRETGCEPSVLNSLVAQLANTSIDRLVFVTRPSEGMVAFEIRSLQEFMAAEAIMLGRDADVIDRLRRIAAAPHWRNVLLFAVGRCLAGPEYFLDNILSIAMELNDAKQSEARSVSRWGSQLAIDVIAEGLSDVNRAIERKFLIIALDLLDQPSDSSIGQLAKLHHDGVDDLFREAVRIRLHDPTIKENGCVIECLAALSERGVEWARDLLRKDLAHDVIDNARSVQLALRYGPRSFEGYLLPAIERSVAHAITTQALSVAGESPWRTALEHCSGGFAPQHRVSVAVKHRISDRPLCYFNIVSIGERAAGALAPLARVPIRNPTWAPYRACGHFCAAPNSETLAEQLEWLAVNWRDCARPRVFSFPWPLACCLSHNPSPERLKELAALARGGALGDHAAWIAAEARWNSAGAIILSDIVAIDVEEWPIGTRIATAGFPCTAVRQSWNVSHRSSASLLLDYYLAAKGPVRWLLAEMLVENYTSSRPLQKDLISDPAVFTEVTEHLIGASSRPYTEWLDIVKAPTPLSREWAEAFVRLGSHDRGWMVGSGGEYVAAALSPWFDSREDWRESLIGPMGVSCLMGGRSAVSDSALTTIATKGNKSIYACWAMLSQRPSLERCRQLGEWIAASAEDEAEGPNLTHSACVALGVEKEASEALFTTLYRKSSAESASHRYRSKVIDIIVELLQMTDAQLRDPGVWESLKLPKVGSIA